MTGLPPACDHLITTATVRSPRRSPGGWQGYAPLEDKGMIEVDKPLKLIFADYPAGQSRMTVVGRELPPSRGASRTDREIRRRIEHRTSYIKTFSAPQVCPRVCPRRSLLDPKPANASQRHRRKPLGRSAIYQGIPACIGD